MCKQVTPTKELKVKRYLLEELKKQKEKKGLNAFISPHEISGVVTEEYDEMKEMVHKNNIEGLRKELIDIVIAAYWSLCSIECQQ